MINIEALKRQKGAMVKEASAVTDLATKENRALTSGEKTQVDSLLKDIRELDDKIEREERSQALEMAGQPVNFTRVHHKNTGTFELNEEDRAFLKYVRSGPGGLDSSERRALVEDSTGQFIVSPGIEEELQRAVAKLVVVRQLASKKVIDVDRIEVRDVEEATVNWGKLETGSLIVESDLAPSQNLKYVEDLNGLVKIGKDELQDSDYDLAMFLSDSFGRAIAEKENLGFLKGAGHASSQPDGITVDPTLVAATKTTADDGVVTIDDFMQCIYAVPNKYRDGSAWIVNSLTALELRKLRAGGSTTTDGPYHWQPSLIQGQPAQFLGYPIYTQDEMDDLSATEGILAIFGNFNLGYRILDRVGITIQRLNELYAEAGLVGFLVHARVGGYLIRPSNKALVLLKEHSA